jgi:hypothetical protein
MNSKLNSAPLERLRVYKPFLSCWHHSLSKIQRELLLKNLTNSQKQFLIDCCCNIQNLNLKISQTQRRKLAKYKSKIKLFASPKISKKQKLDILSQSPQFGGFAGTLLAVLSVVLPPLLEQIFKKR